MPPRACDTCRKPFVPIPDPTQIAGDGFTRVCERCRPVTVVNGKPVTMAAQAQTDTAPVIEPRREGEDDVEFTRRYLRARAPGLARELAESSGSMSGPEISAKKEMLGKILADARPEKDTSTPDPMRNVPLQRLLKDVMEQWERMK